MIILIVVFLVLITVLMNISNNFSLAFNTADINNLFQEKMGYLELAKETTVSIAVDGKEINIFLLENTPLTFFWIYFLDI